jgi:RISC-loading complex subunit TARBP2
LGGNPVGILQELCMKMKLPPPGYDVHSEEGLPHERLFAIACRVGENHIQIGRGKSKKLAKRMAAHLMADYLRALPVETATHHVSLEDDEEICRLLSRKYQLMKMNESEDDEEISYSHYRSRKKPNKISIFEKANMVYKKYADWEGPKADLLDDEEFMPEDPLEFLQELASEQNFKVMVIEIYEKSSLDLYQSLIQLSLDDPAVFWGESEEKAEATRRAAEQAINYFKLMFSAVRALMDNYED